MPTDASRIDIVADVKCYHCGHISGQILARRSETLRPSNFRPREGYTGPALAAGQRLRCERCGGPVFMEDVSSAQSQRLNAEEALQKRLLGKQSPKQAA